MIRQICGMIHDEEKNTSVQYGFHFNWPRSSTSLPIFERVCCGTGAFTDALRKEGWAAQGVDIAPGMLAQAHKKGLSCALGDVLKGLELADHSFDHVSAAYVAHGLRKDDRHRLFTEMRRLSRGLVLLHDYTPDRHPLTTLIEYLEGGDYFNFIQTGEEEMRAVFSDMKVVRVGPRAAWYVCRVG